MPPKTKVTEREALLAEIKEAKETGKTELRISITGDYEEILAELFSVTTLTELNLNVGMLKKLPLGIGNLTQLRSLRIEVQYGEQLATLPPDLGKLTLLDSIHLYNLKLKELPDEMGDLANLTKLVAFSNELKGVPASLGRLTKLDELSLQYNEIGSLPKELGVLVNLGKADLSGNQLTELPLELGKMAKLHTLNLEGNKLTSFPLALCEMASLRSVNLKRNEISQIPAEIRNAKTLQSIDLSANKITEIPDALFDLTQLIDLDLTQNQISEFPAGFARMKGLADLQLRRNPLPKIPEAIVQEGKEAILDHLGLVKREVVTGDLPDEKERQALVKKNQEKIDAFVRSTKRRLTDENMLASIVAFITGKSNVVPSGRLGDHYSFNGIVDVLAPYAEWTFMDRRILRFITQAAWRFQMPGQSYFKGYAEDLLFWLKKQIATETGDQMFSLVANEALAHGADEDEFFRVSLDKLTKSMQREDESVTSYGRYVLDHIKPKIAIVADVLKKDHELRETLSGLLIRYDIETFGNLAGTLLEMTPNSKGVIHLPEGALAKVCAMDPAKFESILLEGMAKTDCLSCKAEAGKILVDSYREKHGKKALEIAKSTLVGISDKMNKEDRYSFNWASDWENGTSRYIAWALKSFGEDIRQAVFEYTENTKVFSLDVAELMVKTFGQKAIDVLGEGLNMHIADDSMASHYRRIFTLLAPLDYSKYYDKAWEIARSEFKQVRQTACMALGRLPASVALPRAKELLASKKGHEREAGVMILSQLDSPEAKKILTELLATEKSDDARDLIVEKFFEDAAAKVDRAEIEKRVASAKARGKLEKPIAKWLDEEKLPALVWAGGKKEIDAETLRFLLYRQTRKKEIEVDAEARGAFPLIDRKTSGSFAEKLLALVLKNGGATAKNRFALVLVGMLGDESVIAQLEELAVEGKNENAVSTIGLLGSNDAARSLDRIAKVFRVKYPNVRQLAQEAFATIADSMGLTPFELADTMLPTFDFAGLSKSVVIAKMNLQAVISADRKLSLIDESKKTIRLPAKASAKEKAEIKALSQEIADASKQFKSSLEYYLIIQRQWRAEDWKQFFLAHPLAFAFAQSLIWGICEGTKIVGTFRVDAEGKLRDVTNAPVTLPKNGSIALAHALDMDASERTKWQAVLTQNDLEPPFSQIDRALFAVVDADKEKKLSFAFEDKEVVGATFKSRAERLGWRRGSVVDSGEVSGYKKAYPRAQIDVFVRTENLSLQLDFDSKATLKDFFFVKTGSVVTGSYTYDEPRAEDDPRLIKFADVPPIVYSETVSDLKNITRTKDAEDS